jgi:hypothetical protein
MGNILDFMLTMLFYMVTGLALMTFYYGLCYLFPSISLIERYPREKKMAKILFKNEINKMDDYPNIKLYSFFSYEQITHWIITRKENVYTLEAESHNVFDKNSRWLLRRAKSELALKKDSGVIDDYEIFWTRGLPIFPQEARIFQDRGIRPPF